MNTYLVHGLTIKTTLITLLVSDPAYTLTFLSTAGEVVNKTGTVPALMEVTF